MEMLNELSVAFDKRVDTGKIKSLKAKKLINLYMDEIEATQQDKIGDRLTSLMILRYLIASGDDMWLEDNATVGEFQKAYRSWGVMSSKGLCSNDCVMWNLMHADALIWNAFEKFVAWRDENKEELKKEEANEIAKLIS